MLYLAEFYLPAGSTLPSIAQRARAGAEQAARNEHGITFVEAIFLPLDESCFLYCRHITSSAHHPSWVSTAGWCTWTAYLCVPGCAENARSCREWALRSVTLRMPGRSRMSFGAGNRDRCGLMAGAARLARHGLPMKTVAVGIQEPQRARWPGHLPVGALRVVRWSAHYDQALIFYRDTIGLPVLETFRDSYGLDGTILGLPGGLVHLEIVRLADGPDPARGLDQLVFYLPDAAAQERIVARLAAAGVHPVEQIDYWQDNGGVTYQDPDGREVVFASWVYSPPQS